MTLMYMASLMLLVNSCASLSTMEKQSWLNGCPVEDVCRCMGEGVLGVPCICLGKLTTWGVPQSHPLYSLHTPNTPIPTHTHLQCHLW